MKRLFQLVVMLAFAVAFTACNDSETSSTGRLSVSMIDAPFPTDMVAEANVTINKIEIRRSGEGEGSPFITLSEEEISLNLLELTNGVTEQLVDLEIAAGSYNLVRLFVAEANVVLKDGSTFDLMTPSAAQTGIKVFINPDLVVAGGLTSELLLDFDVSQSFVPLGDPSAPTGFIFKPVIKAANLSTSGRLVGEVVDNVSGSALEGVEISVYAADTLNTTTFTAVDGGYTVLGLDAGSFEVIANTNGYVADTASVEIVAANATTQNFELVPEE